MSIMGAGLSSKLLSLGVSTGVNSLRGITTRKNFFYIERDIDLKLGLYVDSDMLRKILMRYFGCGLPFPWKL